MHDFLIVSLDCPLRREALTFYLLSIGWAGSDCSRCEAHLGGSWEKAEGGKLFQYISTRGEAESTFPPASCFLVAFP